MDEDENGEGGRLVTLTVYYSVIEAEVCVSMLTAYGIYAHAMTHFARNASHLMTAGGGIEVKVVDSDLEAARELIAAADHAEASAAAHAPSKPFWKTVIDGLAGLASVVFFGVPPAPTPPKVRHPKPESDR